MQSDNNNTCSVMEGQLPGKCAPMVFPYVPMQETNPAVYKQNEALEAGTLFPGLHLPFHREIQSQTGEKYTPLAELMALDFAITELGLYLDTHKDDKEAFALYSDYVRLYREGKERYEKQYGPLQQANTVQFGGYHWLNNPWPWDYEGGKK